MDDFTALDGSYYPSAAAVPHIDDVEALRVVVEALTNARMVALASSRAISDPDADACMQDTISALDTCIDVLEDRRQEAQGRADALD